MPLGTGTHILFEGRPKNKTANPISLYQQGVRELRSFQISCLVSGFLVGVFSAYSVYESFVSCTCCTYQPGEREQSLMPLQFFMWSRS